MAYTITPEQAHIFRDCTETCLSDLRDMLTTCELIPPNQLLPGQKKQLKRLRQRIQYINEIIGALYPIQYEGSSSADTTQPDA